MKPVSFVGSSRENLRALSEAVREIAGFQLYKVQQGLMPDDWKPMPQVGAGAAEIRIRDEGRAYRVVYVARFQEAVYVLHVFHKQSRKTARSDLEMARYRYVDLVAWRKDQGL